jgi:hypothetical protein
MIRFRRERYKHVTDSQLLEHFISLSVLIDHRFPILRWNKWDIKYDYTKIIWIIYNLNLIFCSRNSCRVKLFWQNRSFPFPNNCSTTTKTYTGSGVILKHQYRWVIPFTFPHLYYRRKSPRYPQDKRPVGPHSPFERNWSSPVTILIKLCLITDDTGKVVEHFLSSYRSALKLGTRITCLP